MATEPIDRLTIMDDRWTDDRPLWWKTETFRLRDSLTSIAIEYYFKLESFAIETTNP